MSAKIIQFPERKQNNDDIELQVEGYSDEQLQSGLKTIRNSLKEFKKIETVPAIDDVISALEIGEKLLRDLLE